MEKARLELDFGIDPMKYSGFLSRNPDQHQSRVVNEKPLLSKTLEKSLQSDELELLRQTEREIDECMGSGRYGEAKHLTDLIKSRFGKSKTLSLTISTRKNNTSQNTTEIDYVKAIVEKCKALDGSPTELSKAIIDHAKGILATYDPDISSGLKELRSSRDEDGETDEMMVARRIFRHVPQMTVDFVIKLLMFFPAFKTRFGYFSGDDTLRLRVILWVYSQKGFDLGKVTVEGFYLYLREAFPSYSTN
jgi:hypothetical protein